MFFFVKFVVKTWFVPLSMDLKKLLIRSVSGLIYCLVIVGCIMWGETGVVILGCLLATIACIEFARISHDLTQKTLPVMLLDIAGCLSLCLGILGYTLILWLAITIARFIEELYINSDCPLRDLAHSMMSQIYIGLPMGIMVGIAWLINPMIILALFFLLWINDTGAFLVGCTIGRHKLFERISPKKTWEGFIGGLAFCIGASALFYYFGNDFFGMTRLHADIWVWLGLGAIVSIFGTWGDLIESMIKRNLHIKDSGNIIPGHGGILDRIDSLLLAVPAVAVYFYILIYLAI